MKNNATTRNRAYRRHQRNRVINRKRAIVKQTYWCVRKNQFGRLAKGKIHCSCASCSPKTRSIGYPMSQQARLEGISQQLREWNERGGEFPTLSYIGKSYRKANLMSRSN